MNTSYSGILIAPIGGKVKNLTPAETVARLKGELVVVSGKDIADVYQHYEHIQITTRDKKVYFIEDSELKKLFKGRTFVARKSRTRWWLKVK